MKWIISLCIICSQMAYAGDSVKSKLESILDHSGLKKASVGIHVEDAKRTVLYDHNGSKRFIPASITKLITAAAVLNSFAPYTKIHTQVYTDGAQEGDTLNGNIYLKGMGDPAFVSEKLWMLVDEFSRSGIKRITGNLVADDSFFDDERFTLGREPERNDRAYDAPVGALSFNWNSTTIFVRPGKKVGDKAKVFIDPENSFVVLQNEVTTSQSSTDLQAVRTEQDVHDTVAVRGKISVSADEHHIYKDISNPPLYTAANFREFLKQRGIEIAGNTQLGTTPKSAKLETDFEGEPMVKLVTDMNKFSNNYVAEMLAKNLGALKSGKQGKMADGLSEVQRFCKEDLGWATDSFVIESVSGFTRKNSLSAAQFVDVLSWVQKQFNFYPEFLQSLPVSGVDGTLHNRMKSSASGWVRAKTGLLNGVVALSGVAGSHDGTIKLFAFIYNGGADGAHVRETFDSMASALVK